MDRRQLSERYCSYYFGINGIKPSARLRNPLTTREKKLICKERVHPELVRDQTRFYETDIILVNQEDCCGENGGGIFYRMPVRLGCETCECVVFPGVSVVFLRL